MTPEIIMYLILGGFAGGFINGFSGTGTALFAIGFFLIVMEPKTAVAVVALIAVLSGIQGLVLVRKEMRHNTSRLFRFIIPGMIGVPIGIALLEYINAASLRLLVAVLLIVYGGYFGFRGALPKLERVTPVIDGSVGFVGGILGGLASLSGALPTIWLSMRPWPKAETRAVLQPYNFVLLVMTVVMLAMQGAYDKAAWTALAFALPAGLIAAQLGITVFKRVSDDQFRRTLILLCLVLGVGLLVRELMT